MAVTPTLDCLPMYVARACNLFDTLGADVRLRPYTAQMDCDTAFERSRVEGMATDLVRGQRLIRRGFPLTYVTAWWGGGGGFGGGGPPRFPILREGRGCLKLYKICGDENGCE